MTRKKYLFALAATATLYLLAAPASTTRVECAVQGGTIQLTEEGDQLWFRSSDGTERGLKINRAMSDRHMRVAAATMGGGRTSVVLTDRRHFQQTFITDGGETLFLDGECN